MTAPTEEATSESGDILVVGEMLQTELTQTTPVRMMEASTTAGPSGIPVKVTTDAEASVRPKVPKRGEEKKKKKKMKTREVIYLSDSTSDASAQ